MSDRPADRARRDLGLTLPELLIATVVFGLIIAVLTAGITVTMRQQQDTQSRVDVARWEQNLGMWLPDDLTSASSLSEDPAKSPCGSASSCPGVGALQGSNVLWMSWANGRSTTTVSYRYQPDGPTSYGLYRVACTGATCTTSRVLGDLSSPQDAGYLSWRAGRDVPPASVVDASIPEGMKQNDPDEMRRVTVVVNGVPTADGEVRSSQVSIAAGGARIGTLAPPSFTPPSFESSYSDCGGPITLLVDNSGSIGADLEREKQAVKTFIDTFAGTPTTLQIITFSNSTALIGGPAGAWNHYHDLGDPNVVRDLKSQVDGIRLVNLTNWEAALFRASRTSTGQPLADAGQTVPKMIVLFTDGVPTVDRGSGNGYFNDSAPKSVTIDPLYDYLPDNISGGPMFSPRAWWRANLIADSLSSRLIGVGVGSQFFSSRHMYRAGTTRYVRDWPQQAITHEEFLGDLVAKRGLPSVTTDTAYRVSRYDTATRSWGDVSAADLLVASDMTRAADALSQIALSTCGGTLTVQTRIKADQTSAPFEVTYEAVGKMVTTSRFAKTGTFDVSVGGKPDQIVQLVPRKPQLDQAGYTAAGWICTAKGESAPYTLLGATPAEGIELKIASNQAVACTLEVTR